MDQANLLSVDSEALAKLCVQICEDRKAESVLLYDVRETSVLADFYLICTGNSLPHIRAISEHLRHGTGHEMGILPRSREGDASSHWIVMDYGVVLVHVLDPERRDFYNLEDLWDDAQVVYRSANGEG